jgi:hypothetical protein
MSADDNPIQLRFFVEEADLVGARWWQETALSVPDSVSRRHAIKTVLLVGASLGIGGVLLATTWPDDEVDEIRDALAVQQQEGWDVGKHDSPPLTCPGASRVDAAGSSSWSVMLSTMAATLAPRQAALAPYYVPTLFQVLPIPASSTLRSALVPIHDDAMEAAFARGKALSSLFADVASPTDTAVILDVPGTLAVAAAAGLAERFDPVFQFHNWPHPLGVVPAHLTLAAALYYLPIFQRARAEGPTPAPPVFVLDSLRLSPYSAEPRRFDNRYVAQLPTATSLKALGVRHVLYVVGSDTQTRELDDLNDDLVAYQEAGVEVKMVSLDDFKLPQSEPQPAQASAAAAPRYFWGGNPYMHLYFWPTYGWYGPAVTTAPAPAVRPKSAAFRPSPRTTMFSSRTIGGGAQGIGKQKPSGFGRISVRTSRSTGKVHGTWVGRTRSGMVHAGQSGSWGRSRSRGGG